MSVDVEYVRSVYLEKLQEAKRKGDKKTIAWIAVMLSKLPLKDEGAGA